MSRYTIRKPAFMNGAEQAKYFPNTPTIVGISLLIFLACLIVGVLVTMIYSAAAVKQLMRGEMDIETLTQWVFILAFLAEGLLIWFTVIHVRSIEKRPLYTIGLVKRRFALKYVVGFGIGSLLLGLNFLPAFLTYPAIFTGVEPIAFVFLAGFIIQSAGEEVLFRGYMMSALLRRGSALWALAVSTVVFGSIHILNGYNLLTICLVTLLGAVLGAYMLREGSIWGAMGLHAAWNFFTTCLVTISIGPMQIDFAFFSINAPEGENALMIVIQFTVLAAALALLLFAGRNRLVVRNTQRQIIYGLALKIMRKAVRNGEMRSYALRVSELVQSDEGKITALLYHALGCGASAEYIRQTFGEEIFTAADALIGRQGESPEEYWKRVYEHPAAAAVKNAEARLEEIRRPKSPDNPDAWFSETVSCPLLQKSIDAEYCRHVAGVADGEAPAWGEDYIRNLDRNICVNCPHRRLADSNTASESFLNRYKENGC